MAFDASQWMTPSGSSGYTINNSARFDDARVTYLKKTDTATTAAGRKKFTISCWIKTDVFTSGSAAIFRAEDFQITLENTGKISLFHNPNTMRTSQQLRDANHWYHLVFAVDTTQSTASNRGKIYVNGVLSPSENTDYPAENGNALAASGAQYIGSNFTPGGAIMKGNIAEYHFLEDIVATPADFGETGDYGEWKPKQYTGSYGTNGFYFDFADSSALGNDVSGNDHDFTTVGLAATDQLLDSPTNNFPRFNRLRGKSPSVFQGGLLTETSTNTDTRSVDTNFEPQSGAWYVEVLIKVDGANSGQNATNVGVANRDFLTGDSFQGHENGVSYQMDGTKYLDTTNSAYGASYASGDVIGIAYDIDNDNITFYKNNAAQPQLTSGFDLTNGRVVVATNSSSATGQRYGINFGQDSSFAGEKTAGGNSDANGIGDFLYAVPSGYLALCNSNLPEPAIVPTDYFNTVLYSGTGSNQDITTGFQPNLTWIKNRGSDDPNTLFDSVRGVLKSFDTGSTASEATTANSLTAFNSDNFTVGSSNTVNNGNSNTYVSWNWKAGTSVSGNSTGAGDDIAYTGSVNTDAGFSIIKYGGNGTTGHQIPHRLGVVPDMIWIKNITTQSWNCWFPNTSMGGTKMMQLDNTGAASTQQWLNSKMPTSTVVELEAGAATNTRDGSSNPQPYMMYSFKSIPGFSKFDEYKGNGSVDGTFVHCGFLPSFVLIKVTGLSDERWMMYDNKRDPVNFVSKRLVADDNNVESSGSGQSLDFLSNGFKLRANQASINSAGYYYVFMAFAETPFKYSNAR